MAIGRPVTLTSNIAFKSVKATATAGQTSFTVTGGYNINKIAVFRNGVRLVDTDDYEARDGSSVTLLSGATLGDSLEFQIFDDFRVADAVTADGGTVNGDVSVAGVTTLTNAGINVTGVITATSFVGNGANLTGLANTDFISAQDVTVSGVVTATSGLRVGTAVTIINNSGIDVTGVITATSFVGDGSNLSGVGGTDFISAVNVTVSSASTLSGPVSIADSILHTGDTNTAIRFPAADTFTVETGGSEAIRVDSTQRLLVNTATTRTNYDNGSVTSNLLHVERTAAGGNAGISICANTTTADLGAILYMGRTRATSDGDTDVATDDDLLARISFQGADGSQLVEAAAIRVDVDGTPGANDMPGRIEFHTNSGSASATERLRIDSSGDITPGADATQDLGSASLRWANIFSADLQLSNEGSANDVDGTWGKYTIQEGEDDLFLINRRNGKKYKFVLQEVN